MGLRYTARMTADSAPLRPLLVGSIGTFLLMNVYAPQALLPLLAREFGVSAAQIGTVIGSTTLAMALFSPLSGVLADALGRRRVTVWAFGLLVLPCLAAALTHSLALLNVARFAQGLFIPLGMVGLTAYLADEVPPAHYSRTLTAYVSGTVLGGFLGRFASGQVAHLGHGQTGTWHLAFVMLAVTNALALLLALRLPRERHFSPQRQPAQAAAALLSHLRNPALRVVCLMGFCILFVLVSIFNTVTFRLADAPYHLGSGPLGWVFAVYLLGVVVTPITAPLLSRRGPALTMLLAVGCSLLGLALTLLAPLPVVVVGLAVASSGIFIGQAAAQSAVQGSVDEARSLAGGLYNLAYYAGAAAASVVAGRVFEVWHWPGVVAVCAAALLLVLMLLILLSLR